MNPSYSGCAFKLTLPDITMSDDILTVSYKFSNQIGNQERIVFYKATFIDIAKVKFETIVGQRCFSSCMTRVPCVFHFLTKRKVVLNRSTLLLEFLSNTGKKAIVQFELNNIGTAKLLDVESLSMTRLEEKQYISIIERSTPTIQTIDRRDDYSEKSRSSFKIPELEQYREALHTEKLFLMQGGGKKYKVTNGRLISKTNIYSYLFDLEAELYIADDAPIKISVGMDSASGTVLMCEDFQIIVQLDSGLGDHVGSAVISVEPWKLLEALENRLGYVASLENSKMTNSLLKVGPSLATKLPIDKIPKGQDQVIEKAMNNPVTIVWGPPGTGKTHTMSELAIRFIDKGYTVLIVSHSNVSVDGVAKKIDELLRQKEKTSVLKSGKVLRYGYVRDEELNKNPYVNSFYYAVTKNNVLKEQLDTLQEEYDQIKHSKGLSDPKIINLKKEIGKIRTKIREQEQFYVSKASVVATTISKVIIDKIFEERTFDAVMFDEVSMAYVLQVVAAATFAKKHLICVGDFMQLAPIAQSKAKDVLCQDIFTYLRINQYGQPYYHPWLVMLDEQRRMEPQISEFANKYVYRGLLKNHPSTTTSRKAIVASKLFENYAINLIDLTASYCAASKNSDNSRFNILSALLSFCVALKTENSIDINTVSIITPYAAQTRLIRALVLDYRQNGDTNLRCATVHQFQGSESDAIIFDAVESYPSKKTGWLMGKDFNSILRLINVAVTRARGKLITVANVTFWNNNFKGTNHTFYRLINYLKENGNVIQHKDNHSLESLVQFLSVKGGPQFYFNSEKYTELLKKDVEAAHGKIVISLPSGQIDSTLETRLYSWLKAAEEKGIKVLAKCNDYKNLPSNWKSYTCGAENAIFPVIMIDDHITWYGLPTAPWKFTDKDMGYTTVCHLVCRIKGEHTAEIIKSLSDLEYSNDKRNNDIGTSGLSTYVAKNKKCPSCKHPLAMTKGKSGKTILWCKECKKTYLLSPDDINHYMLVNRVKCPKHNCDMEAKVGQYGLYIRCECGHYLKPEEI